MNASRLAVRGGESSLRGIHDFQLYHSIYESNAWEFSQAVEAFGLPFEETESQPRKLRFEGENAWSCRNGGASLVRGWMSSACERCRTGEGMESFFISLQCPKHCWFCFNENQEDSDYYRNHKRDIAREVKQAFLDGCKLDFIAFTGGEPCLFPDDVVRALRTCRKYYPASHIRLYTSGTGANEAMLGRFAAAGLDEIRFSIKLDDGIGEYERLLGLMEHCVGSMDTMVEMPVEPGSLTRMEDILVDLDGIGVRGVNLLELCYPLANAEEYAKRELRIRNPPYSVLYDYWYAGKMPVAGSEKEALSLMRFSASESLSLGVHYCSLDNKNSGQLFLQNARFAEDVCLQKTFPHCSFDPRDFFLKSIKIFGAEEGEMREAARKEQVPFDASSADVDGVPVEFYEVSLADAIKLRACLPDAFFAISLNVLERREDEWALREVDIVSFFAPVL